MTGDAGRGLLPFINQILCGECAEVMARFPDDSIGGTVPKMCKMLGRQYIGIDISEEYCKIAKARLGESVEDWDPGDPNDSNGERQPRLL